MTIQQAMSQLRAAYPDAGLVMVDLSVRSYDEHNHSDLRVEFSVWNGTEHFRGSSIEEVVGHAVSAVHPKTEECLKQAETVAVEAAQIASPELEPTPTRRPERQLSAVELETDAATAESEAWKAKTHTEPL